MNRKIVILYSEISEDAREDEQDTLTQVNAVHAALSELNFEPIPMPFLMNLSENIENLKQISPLMVFNLVESPNGHGRLIHVAPSLLETVNIPYSGADADAVFLTSNKLLAKKFIALSNLPTPRWFTMNDLSSDRKAFVKGRYIVKSVWEHASVGLAEDCVMDAKYAAELRDRLEALQSRLGGQCFAEEYIEGREFNLSLLADKNAPEVLAPAEIVFEGYEENQVRIVDYKAKWDENSYEYQHTVRSFDFSEKDAPLLNRLKHIALDCWHLFELKGYARVDFRSDRFGNPFILEVNTNPCLSPDAGFAAALKQTGISYAKAIERVINSSLSLC